MFALSLVDFLSLLLSPSTYFNIFYFCQKYHLNYTYKIFKKFHVGLQFEWGLCLSFLCLFFQKVQESLPINHHADRNSHGSCYFSVATTSELTNLLEDVSQSPGPRLNIKTVLSTYGDFHVKDKTAVRTSYL